MRQMWSLQYLRAAASVGVVVYHVLAGTPHPFEAGAAGVDIFFVLSGFLMFALTARRSVTPGRFLLDRAVRIVPLYWIATVTTFAAAHASRDGIHLVGLSPTLLLESFVFLPRGPTVGGGIVYPTLFVGWTLDEEMFFYVLFAMVLPVSPLRRIAIMSAVFGGLVAAGATLHPRDGTLSSDTNPIILEFLEGALIAALFTARDTEQASRTMLMLGLVAVVVLPLALQALPRSGFAFLAVTLVTAALLLERGRLVPEIAAIRFLGDASYSIYLFQVLAFRIADVLVAHGSAALRLPLGRTFLMPAEIVVAIAFGGLAHVAVERPLLRGTRRLLARTAQAPVRIAEASS